MGLWDSIRDETLGTIKDAWNGAKGDITEAAGEEMKKRLGIQAPVEPTAPATPAPVIQMVTTNPITYIVLAGIGALALILLWRK